MKIGIIGANGFLGKTLAQRFTLLGQVYGITRQNYEHFKQESFDVLVNADGNSRRYCANQNPVEDFEASVKSVYRSLFYFNTERYVFISTSDVYPLQGNENTREDIGVDQVLSPYGFNKLLAERIVRNYSDLKGMFSSQQVMCIRFRGTKIPERISELIRFLVPMDSTSCLQKG